MSFSFIEGPLRNDGRKLGSVFSIKMALKSASLPVSCAPSIRLSVMMASQTSLTEEGLSIITLRGMMALTMCGFYGYLIFAFVVRKPQGCKFLFSTRCDSSCYSIITYLSG